MHDVINSPTPLGRTLSATARGLRILESLLRQSAGEPRERAWALHRLCRDVCELHGVQVTTRGSYPEEPVIFVANHHGYIDPLAICSRVPCAPLARHDLADWPLVGSGARKFDVIFVRRDSVASRAQALFRARTLLRTGVSVLNFPEGTTTAGALLPFHCGMFGLAGHLAVPVVPLVVRLSSPALCWVDRETFLGHYARTAFRSEPAIEILVGPRMFKRPTESAVEFAGRVRRWISTAQEGQCLPLQWPDALPDYDTPLAAE